MLLDLNWKVFHSPTVTFVCREGAGEGGAFWIASLAICFCFLRVHQLEAILLYEQLSFSLTLLHCALLSERAFSKHSCGLHKGRIVSINCPWPTYRARSKMLRMSWAALHICSSPACLTRVLCLPALPTPPHMSTWPHLCSVNLTDTICISVVDT